MANKKVAVRTTITYVDADGQDASIPAKLLEPEYLAQVHGDVDVEDNAGAGDFTVPFGAVSDATCILLTNKLGQPVTVNVNDGALIYTGLASGKSVLLALPGGIDTAITECKVTTLATQVGAGTVAYHVWGDPGT